VSLSCTVSARSPSSATTREVVSVPSLCIHQTPDEGERDRDVCYHLFPKYKEVTHVTLNTSILGQNRGLLIMHVLVLLCITQYTKFEVPTSINYKDMIGYS